MKKERVNKWCVIEKSYLCSDEQEGTSAILTMSHIANL